MGQSMVKILAQIRIRPIAAVSYRKQGIIDKESNEFHPQKSRIKNSEVFLSHKKDLESPNLMNEFLQIFSKNNLRNKIRNQLCITTAGVLNRIVNLK